MVLHFVNNLIALSYPNMYNSRRHKKAVNFPIFGIARMKVWADEVRRNGYHAQKGIDL